MLVCMGHMMIYLLGCTSTFMILWWDTLRCKIVLCNYVLQWYTLCTHDVWKDAIQEMGSGCCLVSILGATSNRGYWVTTWEGDCNQSRVGTSMVFPLLNFHGILEIQVWQLNTNFKELYKSKIGLKVQKRFPKDGGKYYLCKLCFYGFN